MPRNESMQSLQRAVRVLYAVAGMEDGCSTQQIAARTGLKSNTLHRFLRTLEEEKLLIRRTGPLRFMLGPALAELKMLDDERHLLSVSGRVLVRSQAKLPIATFSLHELCQATIYSRLCVQSNRPGTVIQQRDFRMPLYHKASSLLFLAYCQPAAAKELMEAHPFEVEGRFYWRSRPQLETFLAQVRRRGYCRPELPDSVSILRVAAPVFSRGREVIAAVGAYIVSNAPQQYKATLARICRDGASEITRSLAETPAARQ